MIRHLTFCALALAVALVAGQAPASSRSSTTARPIVNKGYRVEYRTPGATAWRLAGNYGDRARAQSVAANLYRDGHEVRFTSVESVTLLRQNAPSPEPRPIPKSKPVQVPNELSVVSKAEAQAIFNRLRAQSDIAYRYPADGCYARAHLMCQMILGMGLQPGKGWVFDDAKLNRLVAMTRNHPSGHVQWWYHVAPILKVRDDAGKVRTHVFDPSMFDRPATIFEWQRKMYHPRVGFLGRLECTSMGQAPMNGSGRRFPGTGYVPAADPSSDLTAHARIVMATYKPHQGTAWVPPRVASRGRQDELVRPFNPAAPPLDLGQPRAQ